MSGYLTNGQNIAVLPLTGNERISADTQLTQGIYPQTEAITTGQLATYLNGRPSWVTGRFYGLPAGATPVALLTVASTLYAYPIFVPSTVTISTLNLNVSTGQTGGAAHVGIYADNGAGYPSALLYDSGVLSAASTALVTKSSVALTLQPGIYWMASIFTASGTYPSVTAITADYSDSLNAFMGSDTAAHLLATSGQAATGVSVAGTYGSLPTTFTAGGALRLNVATPAVAIGV